MNLGHECYIKCVVIVLQGALIHKVGSCTIEKHYLLLLLYTLQVAKNANNTLRVQVRSGNPVKDGITCSEEEEELVVADVKRRSVMMMQVKQLEQDIKTSAADGGTTAATAPEPDVVSMETGESQNKEEVKATENMNDSIEPEKWVFHFQSIQWDGL